MIACSGCRSAANIRSTTVRAKAREVHLEVEAPIAGRGFTLVELLVVIAIIGILVALLLPAIKPRTKRPGAQCQNHMKNIALAVLNFESAKKHLPKGFVSQPDSVEAWAWTTFILPYLEEQSIYDQIRPSDTFITPVQSSRTGKRNLADMVQNAKSGATPRMGSSANKAAHLPLPVGQITGPHTRESYRQNLTRAAQTPTCSKGVLVEENPKLGPLFQRVPSFHFQLCRLKGDDRFGLPRRGNETAGWTPNLERCADTGVFFGDSQVTLKQITDGTTNTFMIGERNKFCYAATWVGVRNPAGPDGWSGNEAVSHVATPHGKLNFQCTGDHNTCTEGFSSNHSGGAFLRLL